MASMSASSSRRSSHQSKNCFTARAYSAIQRLRHVGTSYRPTQGRLPWTDGWSFAGARRFFRYERFGPYALDSDLYTSKYFWSKHSWNIRSKRSCNYPGSRSTLSATIRRCGLFRLRLTGAERLYMTTGIATASASYGGLRSKVFLYG